MDYLPSLIAFTAFLSSNAHHLAANKYSEPFFAEAFSLSFAGTKYISISGTICATGTAEKIIASNVDISAKAGDAGATAAAMERTIISLRI